MSTLSTIEVNGASRLTAALAFPLCVYDIDVQEVWAVKQNIKACFPLETSPCLSTAQSTWVATPLPSHLHLKSIWGTCSFWQYPHVYTRHSSNWSFKLNPLQKHNLILAAFTMFFHSAVYLGQPAYRANVWSSGEKWSIGWCMKAPWLRY